jgi:lipopolysaccharide export system protein LptA
VLTHLESEHLVRIEGNTSVVSGTWVIHADVTDVRLAADRSVEFAEARGAVTLEDRLTRRRGSGEKATWRSQADVVSLSGSPAIAYDAKGNRLTGALLTFRQGQSRVDVESSDTIPSGALVKPEGS